MKKLLIWDGDETLWCGTLTAGDVPELPDGRAELCVELCRRGVLQSLASKNLHADALAALHSLGLSQYFLAPNADLDAPKSMMVRGIMDQLGLARAEDVVFVDDQAFQRAEVEANVPGVLVCAPEQLTEIVDVHFVKSYYTDEDAKRVRRYQSDMLRQADSAAYADNYQTFLRACGLKVDITPAAQADLPRIVDLLLRANRMSAVAREFPADELAVHIDAGHLLVCRVADRYGDYGLSGALLVSDARIELLVISCRLQGKGVGSALLGSVLNHHVGRVVQAMWRETEYNAGMRQLYEWYGFDLSNGPEVRASRYITEAVKLPDWLVVNG